MTALEVLRAARKLIEKPDKWVQHTSYEGNRYCLHGAVMASLGDAPHGTGAWLALQRVQPRPIQFNDLPTTTHADVLGVLDKAIAQLGSP